MIDLAARSFVPNSSQDAKAKVESPSTVRRNGEFLGRVDSSKSENPTRKNSPVNEASKKDVSEARGKQSSKSNSEDGEFESKLGEAVKEKAPKDQPKEKVVMAEQKVEEVPEKVGVKKPVITSEAMDSLDLIALQQGLRQMKETKDTSPILEFMDSMESELGIEPERLIEAFGNLNNQQLMMAPQLSADAYIKNLDIEPVQQGRAKELYTKMLGEMKLDAQPNSTTVAAAPLELQSILSEMKPFKEGPLSRSEALDALNKKFFEVYPNRFGRPIGELAQEASIDAYPLTMEPDTTNSKDSQLLVNSLKGQELSEPEVSDDSSAEEAAFLGLGLAKLASDRVSPQGAGAALSQAIPTVDSGVDLDGNEEVRDLMKKLDLAQAKNFSDESMSLEKETMDTEGEGLFQGETWEGQTPANPLIASKASNQDSFAKAVLGGVAADSLPESSSSSSADLVKGVQYLAKQGGGEMKVQLNHESMGEVHLKVAMNEGKVDIQVLTESKEVKKLLESELSSLKMDLSEKKVELNQIKVEVAKDLRGMLQDQLSDQRRQDTMQFWKQFKEENEAMRSMQANVGLSSYKQARPNSLPNQSVSNYQQRDLNSRLDVVA